jgi:hypothetical protein
MMLSSYQGLHHESIVVGLKRLKNSFSKNRIIQPLCWCAFVSFVIHHINAISNFQRIYRNMNL